MDDRNDTSAATTTPTEGVPHRGPRRFRVLAVGIAGVLILVLLGATAVAVRSGRLSVGASAPAAPTSSPGSGSAAVQALIQKANQEQQQAFAQDKPTLMRDTATAAYYAQLVKLDTALRSSGVTALQLRSATFQQVVLQATTAQVTTTETWQADGPDAGLTDRMSSGGEVPSSCQGSRGASCCRPACGT